MGHFKNTSLPQGESLGIGREPLHKGRLSTIELLVLLGLDKLIFLLKIFLIVLQN